MMMLGGIVYARIHTPASLPDQWILRKSQTIKGSNMRLPILLSMLVLCFVGQCAAAAKTIFGYIEKATLVEQNITLPAKLDTGAKSSSLHAIDIKKETINGKKYVRFTVPYAGGGAKFLCEYFGQVRIKPRAQEAERIARPVVWMKIKLGQQEQNIRVNLTDRSRFIYPLLIGRQAIVAFGGLVDPSLKYEAVLQPATELESQ
jgi:hypothetical protein